MSLVNRSPTSSTRPGILKRDGAVEDQFGGSGVRVNTEIAGAFELEFVAGLRFLQGRFQATAGQYFQRVGVDLLGNILTVIRVFGGE